MWVCLNEEGLRVWGDVFPDGKVPVCSMSFQDASLEGAGDSERVILVNFAALSEARKDGVLTKLSGRFGVSRDDIALAIKRVGLPLRKRYTTGVVAEELRFFI
ncbi:MAG: hypothetical protein NWF00_04800 [Candidatus Bathyarchaeota archaeon]|nr:hypothetical protein [Candidatus Bathyarchaeota archaeon]